MRQKKSVQAITAAPYINAADVGRLLGVSYSTARRLLAENKDKIARIPRLGYHTQDVIKAFRLEGTIKRIDSLAKAGMEADH